MLPSNGKISKEVEGMPPEPFLTLLISSIEAEHPDTLTSMKPLELVFDSQRKYKEAETRH